MNTSQLSLVTSCIVIYTTYRLNNKKIENFTKSNHYFCRAFLIKMSVLFEENYLFVFNESRLNSLSNFICNHYNS